ncbi:MAG TPA: hypothetical protein ENJ45_05445 [Phaeodactylibacter sp.]|nr:hypothetical protein [Phaeodactylibacter sp.]
MSKHFFLFLLVATFFFSCKTNIEKVETLDPDSGEVITYHRNKETGAKQGLYTRKSKEGIKQEEAIYENDALHGTRKLYDDKGNLQIEERYDKGLFQGTWKLLYPNGHVNL